MTTFIYQISDIHIKTSRRDEYLEVFNNFFSIIRNNQKRTYENSICVICGDLFDSKDKYYPTDITDAFNFLKQLYEFMPVVIIPGNHDMNINNRSKGDLITPIIQQLPTDKVKYLSKSLKYTMRDIDFYALSLLDPIEPEQLVYLTKSPPSSPNTKMALVHGSLTGANYHHSRTIRLGKEFIDAFDYVLAGDYHDYQFIESSHLNINKSTIGAPLVKHDKTPRVAYAGALFQQNLRETSTKGFILWELNLSTKIFIPTFVQVPNRRGFLRLQLEHDEISKNVIEPEIALDIMIEYSKCSAAFLERMKTRYQEKYDRPITKIKCLDNNQQSMIDSFKKVEEIYNVSSQIALIQQWLIDKKVPDNDIKSIVQIHENMSKKYSNSLTGPIISSTRWKLLRMEWSNLFKFGENNVIDFTKIDGLTSIVAPNASGKSSILDILLFGLFNKRLRGSIDEIFNSKSDNYYLHIEFMVGKDHCQIIREAKKGQRYHGRLFLVNNENCNGLDLDETYVNIAKKIGLFDDFIKTSIKLQDDDFDITKLTNARRKEFISRFLQLDILDKLETEVEQYKKTKMQELKTLNDSCTQLKPAKVLEEDLDKCIKTIESTDKCLKESQATISTLQLRKDEILRKWDPSQKYDSTLHELVLKEIKRFEDQVKDAPSKEVLETQILELNKSIKQCTPVTHPMNESQKNEFFSTIKKLGFTDSPCSAIQVEIDNLQKKHVDALKTQTIIAAKICPDVTNLIKSKESIIAMLETKLRHNFIFNSSSCTSCKTNEEKITEKQLTDRKMLETEITECTRLKSEQSKTQTSSTTNNQQLTTLKTLIGAVESKIQNYRNLQKIWEIIDNENINKKNAEVKQQIVKCQDKLNILANITKYQQKEITLNKHKTIAEQNKNIDQEYNQILKDLKTYNEQYELSRQTLGSAQTNKIAIETQLKNNQEHYKNISILDHEVELIKNYHASLDLKSGVPFIIMKSVISGLESEVNNFLQPFGLTISITSKGTMLDIETVEEVDESKIINIIRKGTNTDNNDITRIKRSLDLASGAQRFIVSVAFRVCLTKLYPIYGCDLLMIDEGFDKLDRNNLDQIKEFLPSLSKLFNYVIIITHVEELQNICITQLKILPSPNGTSLMANDNKTPQLSTEYDNNNARKKSNANNISINEMSTEDINSIIISDSSDDKKMKCLVCSQSYLTANIQRHLSSAGHTERLRKRKT